jgi:hypothetical protein
MSLESWLALNDLAGLDAAGADAHTLAATVDLGLDGLQVNVPATTGGVVGVRDVVAELRAFAAKITFLCHDLLQYQSRVAELPENKPYEERLWKRRAGRINRRPIRIKSCQGTRLQFFYTISTIPAAILCVAV